MEAAAGEDADDGGIGGGLERVADGEPEGIGEGEGFARAGLEGALVVHVGRGAELVRTSSACSGVRNFRVSMRVWKVMRGERGEWGGNFEGRRVFT